MLTMVLSPDPTLLQVCQPCKPGDPALKKLAKEMQETMYLYNGVGLAGPQVGKSIRMIVIDCEYDIDDKLGTAKPITLVNPEIIEKSEEMEESEEGCLSCPGISAPVNRHVFVKVKYFDLDGKEQEISGTGLLSHCLQHEIDHLDGKTLFQTSLPEQRIQLLMDYNEALANGAQPGEIQSRDLQ